LEAALLETAATWEQDGGASGETREVIGAVDATFLERMILVLMALATGYLLLEEVADDRTYPPWKELVKVWTIVHNFDCRAADDPTPAARFFRREFPDLFETVLAHVGDLPRPRQRNQIMAPSG
jgi:hypothetical protein